MCVCVCECLSWLCCAINDVQNAYEDSNGFCQFELARFLLDIQEFYELTLLDETKTIQQKTAETLQMASKWETNNQQHQQPSVIIPTRFANDIQHQQQQPNMTASFISEVLCLIFRCCFALLIDH